MPVEGVEVDLITSLADLERVQSTPNLYGQFVDSITRDGSVRIGLQLETEAKDE